MIILIELLGVTTLPLLHLKVSRFNYTEFSCSTCITRQVTL